MEKNGNLISDFCIYTAIFLNRYAPITVIATVKPPMTAKLITGLICETPVSPYRIPSTQEAN